MNRNTSANLAIGAAIIALFLLIVWTWLVNKETEHLTADLTQLQDSLAFLHRVVDSLKAQTPGVGEYMSTIQLHSAKLWFAGQALNWKLSKYELDELAETVEAGRGAPRKEERCGCLLRPAGRSSGAVATVRAGHCKSKSPGIQRRVQPGAHSMQQLSPTGRIRIHPYSTTDARTGNKSAMEGW